MNGRFNVYEFAVNCSLTESRVADLLWQVWTGLMTKFKCFPNRDRLDEHRLWMALSYVFVDTETDYKYIASVAKNYSIKEVEFSLFERVAPVCICNMFTPVPPACWLFDEKQLVSDIELLIEKRSSQGGDVCLP